MSEYGSFADKGFMRLPAILKLVPIGRSTWWKGVKAGIYPKGVKLSKNVTAWKCEDIMKLVESFHDAA